MTTLESPPLAADPKPEAPRWPTGPLVEEFPIKPRDGRTLYGALHKTSRRGGRRILVRDETGKLLFDTDDQYDLSNAVNKLDCWLDEQTTA